MKDVPQAFLDAIKLGNVKICELFEFYLAVDTKYFFTDFSEDIYWGTPSKLYKALPIQRSAVGTSISLEINTTELQLANPTNELLTAAMNNLLDGVNVIIKRALWDQNSASGLEFVVFSGKGTPLPDRKALVLHCSSTLNTLNIMVPRNIYQQPCNWPLFSPGCTLDQLDYKEIESTTTSDAENDYEILDSTYNPIDLSRYVLGELKITSGDNKGCRRCILASEVGKLTVAVPFPSPVLSGTTYEVYPGCDKSAEVCRDRFLNHENFNGFVYLNAPEESL